VADREDFRIQAKNFDLTNGLNIPRIISGLFFFPHVMGKFAAGTVSAATAGFFAKAGFHPPEVWVYVAAVSETAVAVALELGICTRYVALGAVALLAIAVYSLQVVMGFGWTWNTGGYEYPVFWAIVSFSVAIEACNGHLVRVPSPAVSGPPCFVGARSARPLNAYPVGLLEIKAGRDWHHHSRAICLRWSTEVRRRSKK
jgi:putative oxidoreductase